MIWRERARRDGSEGEGEAGTHRDAELVHDIEVWAGRKPRHRARAGSDGGSVRWRKGERERQGGGGSDLARRGRRESLEPSRRADVDQVGTHPTGARSYQCPLIPCPARVMRCATRFSTQSARLVPAIWPRWVRRALQGVHPPPAACARALCTASRGPSLRRRGASTCVHREIGGRRQSESRIKAINPRLSINGQRLPVWAGAGARAPAPRLPRPAEAGRPVMRPRPQGRTGACPPPASVGVPDRPPQPACDPPHATPHVADRPRATSDGTSSFLHASARPTHGDTHKAAPRPAPPPRQACTRSLVAPPAS